MNPDQTAPSRFPISAILTIKAPITTAADDKFCYASPNFGQKLVMILHGNRLPEIACLICYFEKVAKGLLHGMGN